MATYNSFYGGRRGAPFILVKKYKSVDEMVSYFKLGANYEDVNYDEYVMIDTEDLNNLENGDVYRRGFDFTNELGGAEYVGKIQGPVGYSPHMVGDTYDNVQAIADEAGLDYRRSQGEYTPLESLLPGKYLDENGVEQYNDDIMWALCSVRDQHAKETTAYVGFKFPYLVIDYEAHTVDPYYNRNNQTDNFINQNLIQRDDDGQHPYYQHHSISIPKGIKGDSFKNLKVVPAYEGIEDYEGKADDIANQREVLVYTYYHYDKNGSGEPVDIYLGDYNMVEDIYISRDGRLTIEYTHGDPVETTLRWVVDVDTDNEGVITLTYTTGEKKVLSGQLNYIKRMVVTEDYHLLVLYTDPYRIDEIKEQGLNATYDGIDDWLDLGSMKDDSGMLVGMNIDPDEITETTTIAGAINYLNTNFPNGLQGIDLKGKLVTVGKYNEDKIFYCFDYNDYTWYYIGGIQPSYAIVGREDDLTTRAAAASMPIGGLWFIVND